MRDYDDIALLAIDLASVIVVAVARVRAKCVRYENPMSQEALASQSVTGRVASSRMKLRAWLTVLNLLAFGEARDHLDIDAIR